MFALFTALGCGGGGATVGTITFGALLNQLSDKVEGIVRQAEQSGKGVLIEGGSQVYSAIGTTKQAYNESLNLTFEQLDRATQGVYNQLKTLTSNLEDNSFQEFDKLSEQAQLIANTLPFSKSVPQVRSFSPSHLAKGFTSIPIEIFGNFVDANGDSYEPYLSNGKDTIYPIQILTTKIKFLVPPNFIIKSNDSIKNYQSLSLHLPYKKGWWIFSCMQNSIFKILITVLPNSIGIFKITQTIPKEVEEIKNARTPETWCQHSSNDDDKGHKYSSPNYTLSENGGYTIIPETVKFITEWSQGDENDQWSKSLESTSPQVTYSVTTIHHRFGTSGKVNFHFEYQLKKKYNIQELKEQIFTLKWGESRVFDMPAGSWKIFFTDFDNVTNEYNTSEKSNYLNIEANSTQVKIQVKNPQIIK